MPTETLLLAWVVDDAEPIHHQQVRERLELQSLKPHRSQILPQLHRSQAVALCAHYAVVRLGALSIFCLLVLVFMTFALIGPAALDFTTLAFLISAIGTV